MVKIIIGTTPTIKYRFSVVDPADFTEAIMTIKDSRKTEKLRKTLDEATVGTDYIEWTLTQEETLSLGTGNALSMMLNWLTHGGTRGASAEEAVMAVNNHIREVMSQSGQSEVQRVVDQQSVMTGISALSAAQANGFSNAEISRCNGLYNLTSQLNNIAMNQQNCCCENRAAVVDLKYTVAQEGSATRDNTNAKVQQVLDKLCQLEMDGMRQNYENRIAGMQNTIDQLRTANSNARFDASQNLQTAQILADNAVQTANLEQYLAPTPRPAYVVQNPNCCAQQTFGCGCGAA